MTAKLTLYTRKDCCLCEEMKATIRQVAQALPLELTELDVEANDALKHKYGDEVPVLLIDGRKAFKYRVTAQALEKSLRRKRWLRFNRGAGVMGKEPR